jgi:hypothetical protein
VPRKAGWCVCPERPVGACAPQGPQFTTGRWSAVRVCHARQTIHDTPSATTADNICTARYPPTAQFTHGTHRPSAQRHVPLNPKRNLRTARPPPPAKPATAREPRAARTSAGVRGPTEVCACAQPDDSDARSCAGPGPKGEAQAALRRVGRPHRRAQPPRPAKAAPRGTGQHTSGSAAGTVSLTTGRWLR